MLLVPEIAAGAADIADWRRTLHAMPEILYDLPETAAFVAEKLREFGCDEVVTGIGRTGVVGIVTGRLGEGGRTVGLRADMDALPIAEATPHPYASRRPGAMHACGHDGHMAMLLGAARHLCRTRAFRGHVAFVFQPAEEGGAGALAMIEDGLMERFGIEAVYGMHNLPGLPVGQIALRPGPIMAATDEFEIAIRGKASHAALPHEGADPILAGAALVQALQQISARNVDPLDSLVLSVTRFHSGFARNIIPDEAQVSGTVRSLTAASQDLAERRIEAIAKGVAAAHGASASVVYKRNYPVTVNDIREAAFCAAVAADVCGAGAVDAAAPPLMAAEDFSYMLEARPGAFVFLGNGASAGLHNPGYDFDDTAIPFGSSYWVRLVERALAN
ncbi:M20 aminoacylase family protein [Aureimonas sp. Leaf324]|jgi:hippurate hydrolase|uniref:M20 aminoacylase family protein n=1 Tax=Aureimonas sp. Leaf324 TaxID=1736336 RepID=UPI0006FAAD92|nr:M20 aminoacylase family protein [Aureimonas sp. Leaf324]KQQ81301.1 amidohydrolase [Aureimonas sp. Leaf324]